MAEVLGPRDAAVARELTKLHEEVLRGTLVHLANERVNAPPLRGEIVVIVGSPVEEDADDDTVRAELRNFLEHMSVRDAASEVASRTGRARRDVYRMALALSGEGNPE